MSNYPYEISYQTAKWLKENYKDIDACSDNNIVLKIGATNLEPMLNRETYRNILRLYVNTQTINLIDAEMPKEENKPFEGYFYTSTMQKIKEEQTDSTVQLIERLQFEKAMLEKEVEELQSELILQRSRARVLINYYKERNTLNQHITKLEEELNG
jgi:hypothetical protein